MPTDESRPDHLSMDRVRAYVDAAPGYLAHFGPAERIEGLSLDRVQAEDGEMHDLTLADLREVLEYAEMYRSLLD